MKSLETALRILELFGHADRPLGVSEISARLGFGKGHVSKVLGVFRDGGILQQDPQTRKFSVGVVAFAIGTRFARSHLLSREALPAMRRLADRCGHSVTMSVMHEDSVIHLMAVEGPLFLDGRWRVGNWMPYHATSAGKVLIAFKTDAEIASLIERKPPQVITSRTICNGDDLIGVLRKVRASGVSISRGESQPGLGAIAVPILSATGKVVAALGLVFADHLVATEVETKLVDQLLESAREISSKLGAPVYPYGGRLASQGLIA